jgi:hypothetical protein
VRKKGTDGRLPTVEYVAEASLFEAIGAQHNQGTTHCLFRCFIGWLDWWTIKHLDRPRIQHHDMLVHWTLADALRPLGEGALPQRERVRPNDEGEESVQHGHRVSGSDSRSIGRITEIVSADRFAIEP